MKPNGRDYQTDPVLKRLADSDHATLILAHCLEARGSHTEGFQDLEVYGEDDGRNQRLVSDVTHAQCRPFVLIQCHHQRRSNRNQRLLLLLEGMWRMSHLESFDL